MHHCLQISEIQSEICKELDSSIDAGTLLSLALSCKTFLIPAMTVLWEQQGNVLPLLWCIPDNGWINHRRVTQKEDWDRPLFYSQFITKIVFDREGPCCDIPFGYNEVRPLLVSLTLLSTPLLYNLKVLDFSSRYDFLKHDDGRILDHDNGAYEGQLDFIAASLGSRLNHFALLPREYTSLGTISTIFAKSPSLSTLEVVYGELEYDGNDLASLLKSCRELRSVNITPIDPSVILTLSHLPHLEKLNVSNFNPETVPLDANSWRQIIPQGVEFPSLQSLIIQNFHDTKDFLGVLSMIKHSPLEEFEITLTNDENGVQNIQTILSSFPPVAFSPSLTVFSLECYNSVSSDINNPPEVLDLPYVSQTIEWLLQSREIEDVNILTPSPYSATNEELSTIAGTWKNLGSLYLRGIAQGAHSTSPRATIEGLAPLALACPGLEKVIMCIDATNVPLLLSSVIMKKRRREFKHKIPILLLFFSSPIQEDYVPVATRLAQMFWSPRLDYYDNFEDGRVKWPEEDHNGVRMGPWNRVNDELLRVVDDRTRKLGRRS